ncbi:hypothetical protein H112_06111 [Trichophyton rubrum D6]|nr:uncharacterized protein TERG_03808 [Trichophyton rubrum CBS 118892]EZF14286.1 hypothetical protein H100_06126 [Trichophyton rubrum MR850]EZF39776.1 hypothetical protein H102_06094 [Trichophyton rubrum CBS 100081]EZF50405.1 hypothetical protein H103_06119 [Trichophyton rubrum CBS 288.86]EZF60997.1 hypothetical protein H104_06106 [Trichophyton rubrum CBS 289.86]EZF71671.1 hypothetical protein H105_06131 [Trichophyton soudanense CBS 452.61]EZF82467.1 hypothetical protein H110_06114 [Trichophy
MDQPFYVIDPDGEVDIVLTNPDAPFAIFDENQFEQQDPRPAVENTREDSRRPREKHRRKRKRSSPPSEPTPAVQQTTKTVRIRVSAKHLSLASPVFRSMLNTSCPESATVAEKGSVVVGADGWDVQAFMLFLRILHCQHHHLPRRVSIEMLAKIALISDYYECKFVLAFFSDTWIRALADKKPSRYSRDMILWIWICWYFQLAKEFQRTTLITIVQSIGPIPSLGLPIPARIIDTLNESREWFIGNILKMLYERREILLNGTQTCSPECGSMSLGSLMKRMHTHGLLKKRPEAPFLSLSCQYLTGVVFEYERTSPSTCYCEEIDFESRFGDVGSDFMGLKLDMFV